MNQTEIAKKILSYMEEPEGGPHYAISLHGPWGCGKTHFCEHKLRSKLKENEYAILRISLFGVATIDDFYARALSATTKLEGALATKLISAAGKGAGTALGIGQAATGQFLPQIGKFISDCGFQASIKPETILSIIPMDNILVILDDIERSKLGVDSTSFYGLVNDLCENHNWHVMLVTNKPIAFSNESAEKVVLWQMEYEPIPEELYDSIVKPRLKKFAEIDFDVRASALRGIADTSNLNARSLLKCLETIEMALSSPALSNTKVSLKNRACAFSDFIHYALLTATENQPKSQDNLSPEMKDYLEGYDYENYSILEKSLAHLTTGKPTDPELINQCIDAYIQDRYPDSEPDRAFAELNDKCKYLFELDDDDVNVIVSNLKRLLKENNFSGKSIHRAWRIYKMLSNIGFCSGLSEDSVIATLTSAIDADPVTAENSLKHSYEIWKGTPGIDADPTLDMLLTHASEQSAIEHQKAAHDLFEKDSISLDTGSKITGLLSEAIETGNRPNILIPGASVAQAFIAGSATSQNTMRRFFAGELPKDRLFYGAYISDVRRWLEEIKSEMANSNHQSKMGAARADWFIKDIEGALDAMRE